MPEKSTRRSAKEERKHAILDASATLFASRGFSAVTLEEIGGAVGITGPGLYRHFKNKQELLAQILLNASHELKNGGEVIAAKELEPIATLREMISFHVDFSTNNPNTIRLQDRDLIHLATAQQNLVRDLQRSYIKTWIELLAKVRAETDQTALRLRVQATFGLLNSTPRAVDHTTRSKAATASILSKMAFAALTA